MDITPSYVSIGKLFERNILFEVPKYQRYYAWEDEQVEDFIEDIAASSFWQATIARSPIANI